MIHTIVLTLILTLTGQGQAVARGAMAAAGPRLALELCDGSGTVRLLDERVPAPGRSVHDCPDCLPGLASALLPEAAGGIAAGGDALPMRVAAPVDTGMPGALRRAPNARGPPARA